MAKMNPNFLCLWSDINSNREAKGLALQPGFGLHRGKQIPLGWLSLPTAGATCSLPGSHVLLASVQVSC